MPIDSIVRSETPSKALSSVPIRSGLNAVSERLWFGRGDVGPVQDGRWVHTLQLRYKHPYTKERACGYAGGDALG